MVGPENPSELQGWLEKKKVDEGDFAKCLDRRPWTTKLPMIKVGIQFYSFSCFGMYSLYVSAYCLINIGIIHIWKYSHQNMIQRLI